MKKPKYKITKPIRLIELFAGIGSQAKALLNIDANFEYYKVVEIDKYAIASYNAIHGTDFETSDITKITAKDLNIVDTNKYEYIMTYSFPCQDLSLAGKGAGMKKGTNTRSGLLWEVERLLDECLELPQILLMENVPQVINKVNYNDFREWEKKLESLGYSNYYNNINAKDFGIPQNRNRTFMVSILGDYYYEFPKKKKLKLRLKDMLEYEVEEKFYLNQKIINIIQTIKTQGDDIRIIVKGNYSPSCHSASRVVDIGGIAPTVMENHGTVTAIVEDSGYSIKSMEKIMDNIRDVEGVSSTITANPQRATIDSGNLVFTENQLRIRKLTPKECWRLMGFDDEDFEKASKVNSNTQLYKQAGNSIVVQVLESIFKELL